MFLPFFVLVTLVAAEPAPPASEATIDAFIAVLPPAKPSADPGQVFDQDRLDRLLKLNPGREAEARAAFQVEERCEERAKEKAVTEALRSSARRLGDEKLKLLADFYRGPDYARFTALSGKNPDDLPPAEQAELERIRAKYPLDDYAVSMRQTEQAMWQPEGLMGELFNCHEAYQADLERRGLNS